MYKKVLKNLTGFFLSLYLKYSSEGRLIQPILCGYRVRQLMLRMIITIVYRLIYSFNTIPYTANPNTLFPLAYDIPTQINKNKNHRYDRVKRIKNNNHYCYDNIEHNDHYKKSLSQRTVDKKRL